MEQFFRQLTEKTNESELFHLDSTVNLIIFENGALKNLNTLNSSGVAVRAMVDGKLGQAVVSDFRNPEQTADRILQIARLGEPVHFSFSNAVDFSQINLKSGSVESLTVKDIIDQGREAVAMLTEYDPDVSAGFIGERTIDRVHVLTSRGTDVGYERMFYSFGLHSELVTDQNILQISQYHKGIHMPPSPVTAAKRLIRLLETGRKNVLFKGGKVPVLLAPPAMADILMAFTESVDGEMVAKGVSPLKNRLGDTVLDPRISILDDPLHPDGIMSCPCDDEGTPTSRKYVIEKGILKSFLTNLKSAAMLRIPSSGNGFRSVPFEKYKSFTSGISSDFSNLVIEPGEIPLEKLRGDLGYAIEIHQINGILLGDLIGGDFSGSLELAFLIQNGERVGRVKNCMISGNFFKLFKDQLMDISRESEWSGTFGGCSGAMLLPWITVADMEISGLR